MVNLPFLCELRKSVCTKGITELIVKRNLPDAMIGVGERMTNKKRIIFLEVFKDDWNGDANTLVMLSIVRRRGVGVI